MRTWLRLDPDGWFCYVGFWQVTVNTDQDLTTLQTDIASRRKPATPPDKQMRVGPFLSRQIAKQELRGPFRTIVTAAYQEYCARVNGTIIADSIAVDEDDTPHNTH